MKHERSSALLVTLSSVLLTASAPAKASDKEEVSTPAPADVKISGPYTQDNLTVFLLHGEDRLKGRKIIPLSQALAEKKVIVHETGQVNQLQIENVSSEEVFLQSGDIVKGGRQDRAITLSAILPPKSGKLPIDSFCVEHGRWTKRGGESDKEFNASDNMLATKGLKLAAKRSKNQSEVWENVEATQNKLSASVGKSVKAGASESSLDLSLRDGDVAKQTNAYLDALEKVPNGKSDVIGYAFAINGKMNSAELYASPRIFNMVWGKLIRASAVEALAEKTKGVGAGSLTEKDVRAFMIVSGEAHSSPKAAKTTQREIRAKDRAYFEAVDDDAGWIQQSYY